TGNTIKGNYAEMGDYTVTLTVFTSGVYASNTSTVHISEKNVSMLNRQDYNFFTGGAAAGSGKSWRIAGETKGHMGVGPVDSDTPSWWSAGANEKAAEGLYDDRMIFNLNGFAYTYNNNGNTFSNWEFIGDLGGSAPDNADKTIPYTPPTNM